MKQLKLRHPAVIVIILLSISTLLIFSFVTIGGAEDSSIPSDQNTNSEAGRAAKISGWTETFNDFYDIGEAEFHGWRHSADIGVDNWYISEGDDYTPPQWDRKKVTAETTDTVSDKHLISPEMTIGSGALLTFFHNYEFEANNYDGGVIEISVAGGGWSDLETLIVDGYGNYNATITAGTGNPLAGRPAWTGTLSGIPPNHFYEVRVDLAPFEGNSVRIRWRMACDWSIGGNTFWNIDDVSVDGLRAQPLAFLTARSGLSQNFQTSNTLEWANPLGEVGQFGYTRIILKPDSSDGDPNEGINLYESSQAGQKDSFVHEPLSPNQTYYYAAFVYDGVGSTQDPNSWSTEKTVTAYTFNTTNNVKWAYHMGATSLAPPGIGSVMGLDNHKGVHSFTPGTENAGYWPQPWTPIKIGAPAQARPTVVTIPFPVTPTKVIYLSSQDGKVYAINGETGGTNGAPPLWSSADFGTLQGGTAGIFTYFGGSYNLLFAGGRSALGVSTFFALDPVTGATLFSFDGGTDPIGIISGMASVDYDTNLVYFTSRSYGGGNPSVWCLRFNGSSFGLRWSRDLGDIDASPTLFFDYNGVPTDDRIYVGTNNSVIYALNALTGATIWSETLIPADGAIKSFIAADPSAETVDATPLYFSTNTRTWCLLDNKGAATQEWSQTTIGEPSAPLFAITVNELYVGSSFGRLYQLNTLTGEVLGDRDIGDTTSMVGSPALDAPGSMLYVGTEAGAYYAVEVPLQ